MSAYLEINENGAPKRYLCGTLTTIGRDVTSSLQLNDPLVSRIHVLVRLVGNDSFYILDAGSRNGAFVNNRRISTPTLLAHGDVITLGDSAITFCQERSEEQAMLVQASASLGETVSHVRLEIQPITILVADIRGFTSLTEQIPIAVLSKLMSRWFSDVQETIERRNGRVDKFIGDAVMALWYHGHDIERSAIHNCLLAACEIQQLTGKLSQRFPELAQEMRIAAGVNTGMAATGVGHENTAMGDAVNLAFRLENACRPLVAEVVLSESTFQHLPDQLWRGRQMEITVKGKTNPSRVCALTFADLSNALGDDTQSIRP